MERNICYEIVIRLFMRVIIIIRSLIPQEGVIESMPTYEYRCKSCGECVEVQASLAEKEKGLNLTCPRCGSPEMVQTFSSFVMGSSKGKSFSGGCSCGGSTCSL